MVSLLKLPSLDKMTVVSLTIRYWIWTKFDFDKGVLNSKSLNSEKELKSNFSGFLNDHGTLISISGSGPAGIPSRNSSVGWHWNSIESLNTGI